MTLADVVADSFAETGSRLAPIAVHRVEASKGHDMTLVASAFQVLRTTADFHEGDL